MQLQQEMIRSVQNIQTRLGMVEFDNNHIYSFAKGLYGFENLNDFVFAPLPGIPVDKNYMVLQSAETSELCFVVMRIKSPAQNISGLKSFLETINHSLEEVTFALIMIFNSDRTNEERVTFNQKAPLVFSLKSQEGWQIILE